jgi:hypothetical protein
MCTRRGGIQKRNHTPHAPLVSMIPHNLIITVRVGMIYKINYDESSVKRLSLNTNPSDYYVKIELCNDHQDTLFMDFFSYQSND